MIHYDAKLDAYEQSIENALERELEEKGTLQHLSQEQLEAERARVKGSRIVSTQELEAERKSSSHPTRTALNMRVPTEVILKLKAKAAKLGMPYQTYINSELYKLANQE